MKGFCSSKSAALMSVILFLLALWYVMVVVLNYDWQKSVFERAGQTWDWSMMIRETMKQERPIMPAPHQVLVELQSSIFGVPITSKRSLIYHSGVTLSATLLGFVIGSVLGIGLAIGIVFLRSLDKALLPWVISSQTIPILAIAPMIIVVLGSIGLKGLLPKAIIAAYLCFFPVTIGMIKGLRSPNMISMDLMHSYNASRWQLLRLLRFPASMPFLFASLKVAIAASLVGTIVGELPTGAIAGLGARLLSGSYYGQTIQIWVALIMASILAASLVWFVGVAERYVQLSMGQTPTKSNG